MMFHYLESLATSCVHAHVPFCSMHVCGKGTWRQTVLAFICAMPTHMHSVYSYPHWILKVFDSSIYIYIYIYILYTYIHTCICIIQMHTNTTLTHICTHIYWSCDGMCSLWRSSNRSSSWLHARAPSTCRWARYVRFCLRGFPPCLHFKNRQVGISLSQIFHVHYA